MNATTRRQVRDLRVGDKVVRKSGNIWEVVGLVARSSIVTLTLRSDAGVLNFFSLAAEVSLEVLVGTRHQAHEKEALPQGYRGRASMCDRGLPGAVDYP